MIESNSEQNSIIGIVVKLLGFKFRAIVWLVFVFFISYKSIGSVRDRPLIIELLAYLFCLYFLLLIAYRYYALEIAKSNRELVESNRDIDLKLDVLEEDHRNRSLKLNVLKEDYIHLGEELLELEKSKSELNMINLELKGELKVAKEELSTIRHDIEAYIEDIVLNCVRAVEESDESVLNENDKEMIGEQLREIVTSLNKIHGTSLSRIELEESNRELEEKLEDSNKELFMIKFDLEKTIEDKFDLEKTIADLVESRKEIIADRKEIIADLVESRKETAKIKLELDTKILELKT